MAGARSDEQIMADVTTGRADCLEMLVRRYATPLLTFIHRLVGDRHRAEDLFQEVFLAVWTSRHRYESPRPFRPWLYTIALNRCRAWLRVRREPVVALEPVSLPGVGGSPDSGIRRNETAQLILEAVERLPTQQRIVVSLRVWEDMPYAQIAEILNLTESTVRSHMHHALATLRRDLSEPES